MPTLASAATDAASAEPARRGRRVVDAPTRMAHALIALSFAGAYLSAESESWHALHLTFGYVLAGVLAFRLLYGLVGPRQARVALWFRKLAGAPGWWRGSVSALRAATPRAVPWRQGQNLVMASSVVALVLLLPPLLMSGLAPELGWVRGSLADALGELHEALGEALLAAVLLHVGLVAALSLLRRQNQAWPMLSGRVPGTGPDLVRRNHVGLAVLLLGLSIAFVGWRSHAGLATPSDASRHAGAEADRSPQGARHRPERHADDD